METNKSVIKETGVYVLSDKESSYSIKLSVNHTNKRLILSEGDSVPFSFGKEFYDQLNTFLSNAKGKNQQEELERLQRQLNAALTVIQQAIDYGQAQLLSEAKNVKRTEL